MAATSKCVPAARNYSAVGDHPDAAERNGCSVTQPVTAGPSVPLKTTDNCGVGDIQLGAHKYTDYRLEGTRAIIDGAKYLQPGIDGHACLSLAHTKSGTTVVKRYRRFYTPLWPDTATGCGIICKLTQGNMCCQCRFFFTDAGGQPSAAIHASARYVTT